MQTSEPPITVKQHDNAAVVRRTDLKKNGNYRMAEGGFENPGYKVPDEDDVDFHDANETAPFIPASSSTPGPVSGGDIEMTVRHRERGGGP